MNTIHRAHVVPLWTLIPALSLAACWTGGGGGPTQIGSGGGGDTGGSGTTHTSVGGSGGTGGVGGTGGTSVVGGAGGTGSTGITCFECACSYKSGDAVPGCADTCDNTISGAANLNFCNGVPALSQCEACIFQRCGATSATCVP